MRSLLVTPSTISDDILVEAADWAEVTALFRADGCVSREDLARALCRRSGIKEARAREISDDAFSELANRAAACSKSVSSINRYPFSLGNNETLLSLRHPFKKTSNFGLLYWFLLFVTRGDMSSSSRTLSSIDPTKVFERLCADVLSAFWGGSSEFSGAMVMGTSGWGAGGTGQFRSRIEDLCKKIGEGVGWRPGAKSPGAGDGKLDIVAWKRFADQREGGLVGFAQCKTGIHWKEHLTKLQPSSFCHRFLQKPLLISPLRLYLVPHRIVSHRWEEATLDGGLLFDRCRILQYAHQVSPATLGHSRKWFLAAYQRQKSGRVTS